jgi:hypothetical protein
MNGFVNSIDFGDVDAETRDPFDITLEALAESDTALVTAKRFDYPPVEGDAGVDISSNVSIVGQVVTVVDWWKDPETHTKGVKRIFIEAKNSDNSAQAVANVFINVL